MYPLERIDLENLYISFYRPSMFALCYNEMGCYQIAIYPENGYTASPVVAGLSFKHAVSDTRSALEIIYTNCLWPEELETDRFKEIENYVGGDVRPVPVIEKPPVKMLPVNYDNPVSVDKFLIQNGFSKEKRVDWKGDVFYSYHYRNYNAISAHQAIAWFVRNNWETFPHIPTVTESQVEAMIASAGRRLDVGTPPDRRIMEAGVAAALNLPPGEITLRSRAYQSASTIIDSSLYRVFGDRERTYKSQFGQHLDLPCSTANICQVVHAVYERAILIGPALTYDTPISYKCAAQYAHTVNGLAVVAQDEKYCWLFPKTVEEVWCYLDEDAELRLRLNYLEIPVKQIVTG